MVKKKKKKDRRILNFSFKYLNKSSSFEIFHQLIYITHQFYVYHFYCFLCINYLILIVEIYDSHTCSEKALDQKILDL